MNEPNEKENGISRVGFVILHYGKMDVTERCLESIFSLYGEEKGEILLVDNDLLGTDPDKTSEDCSERGMDPAKENDDQREQTKVHEDGLNKWEKFANRANFHVIRTNEVGFSAANNAGYRWMREHCSPNGIVVGNNDLIFEEKDFLERLFKMPEDSFDVMGPDIMVKWSGIHQNPMGRRIPTAEEAERTIRLNEMALHLMPLSFPYVSRWLRQQEEKGDAENYEMGVNLQEAETGPPAPLVLHGSCLIFGGRFLREEEKAFWPETNFYYEEYILARRCMEKGYRMVYNPSLKVVHDAGRATADSVRGRMAYVKRKLSNTAEACRAYLEDMRVKP